MATFFGKKISVISVTRRENVFVPKKAPCMKLLRALSNEKRVRTLLYLQHNGSSSVEALAEYLHTSEASTSRHLRILRSSYLLNRQQIGLFVFHSIKRPLPKLVRCALQDYLDV